MTPRVVGAPRRTAGGAGEGSGAGGPGEAPGGGGSGAGLRGRGVRIAVIDSGVHPDHPHICAERLSGGVAFGKDGRLLDGAEGDWRDRLGHGTAVTAAIQERAPDADCRSVRVFHDALRTSGAALIAALEWCTEQRVDLANLSLGSTNAAHGPLFAQAVARARAAGVVVVAARAADGVPCFPGSLPGVLGVGLDWDCPRATYRVDATGFQASGYPRPIPGVPPRRNLYGVSFAVAHMTGFAALACEHLAGTARGEGRTEAVCRWLKARAGQGAVAP